MGPDDAGTGLRILVAELPGDPCVCISGKMALTYRLRFRRSGLSVHAAALGQSAPIADAVGSGHGQDCVEFFMEI